MQNLRFRQIQTWKDWRNLHKLLITVSSQHNLHIVAVVYKKNKFSELHVLILFSFITVLIRVKVKLVDTTIRLEYLPTDSNSGVAIIIKIKRFVVHIHL